MALAGCGSANVSQSPSQVNPAPSITSLSPSSTASGSQDFTLIVSGSDFVAASRVNWDGTVLGTTYVNASQLTALIPASDLTAAGSASVTVVNPTPGGGTSNAATFTITATNPVPSVSSLSPASAAAGSTAVTLAVSGSDFVASSAVDWDGSALATTYVSASQLTALIPASELTTTGSASVTVVNPTPGGGTLNAATFTITATNPVPSVSSLSPASAAAGSTAVTLAVSGSDFVASSAVDWDGSALATTYVSASQLTALIPASELTTTGSASVTVVNPTPGGGTSNAATFTITATNPVPSVTSLSPASAAAGSTAVTLTVSGNDFVASSAVHWNGAALATTHVSASKLTALIPASDLTAAGSASVTVVNPTPGGGTLNAATFTITATNPVPSVTSLSPASAAAGSTAVNLTIKGSDFVATSAAHWNGAALATTYVSASQLTALIPASDLKVNGSASVTVVNPTPGGGASNAVTFAIDSAGSGAYIRQSKQYIGYPEAGSTSWLITLANVQAGSTLYVVGTWPNFASTYPTMHVVDGTNTYTLLDRYDDKTVLNLGIQGTQSMGHWYAANVAAGTYTINMTPTPATEEDWVAFTVFEVAGISASPLDGHAINFQAGMPPATNTLTVTVTSSNLSGIFIAVTFDDVDYTAPTVPLVGTGFTDAGQFWDFTNGGKPAARAEYLLETTSGAHTAIFSPEEGGTQHPDYETTGVLFH